MMAAQGLAEKTDTLTACKALGVPRASYYRWQNRGVKPIPPMSRRHPLALTDLEKQAVLNALHSDRFIDKSPGEIVPTLLDEGVYLCSERTMYRILDENNEVKDDAGIGKIMANMPSLSY